MTSQPCTVLDDVDVDVNVNVDVDVSTRLVDVHVSSLGDDRGQLRGNRRLPFYVARTSPEAEEESK